MENHNLDHRNNCCHAHPHCNCEHKCHHCGCGNQEDSKMKYFLDLADEAWEEVLKDKIKEYILKTQSAPLTKLAQIVAEGNHHRWKNRIGQKQNDNAFTEELCNFFQEKK